MLARLSKAAAFIGALLALTLGAWQISYPDHNDPKNLRYTFWKRGLASFDLDQACGTMIEDRNARSLVIGKSKEQLQGRSGFLTRPSEAGPYLERAYAVHGKGQDAAYIRRSPWLVIFHGGRATDLILMKGD
jgi:hypothetical protein